MMTSRYARVLLIFVTAVILAQGSAFAQAAATQTKPFEPQVGQPGKDVVWVPTPQALVEKMLDMAKLTPQDFHMDLGSGDGRTVITAAKRGARAEGIEYNPDMVALSQKAAQTAGVSDKATFRKADIFETDFSKANVITLFLLPQLNMKLRPTILNMRPGTRIVSNTFTMEDWTPDETQTVGGDCVSWCTAHLWIVPAKVQGTWDVPGRGTLTLNQTFQMLSGTLGSAQVSNAKLRADEITFTAGGATYTGKVTGNTMALTANGTKLTATKK
jgi:hypothetical protein